MASSNSKSFISPQSFCRSLLFSLPPPPPSHKIVGLATLIPPAFALSCLYFKNPFDHPGLASSLGALGYPSVANRVTWCIFFSFSFSFSPFLPSFCFSPSLLILALSNSEATGSRSSIVAVTAPCSLRLALLFSSKPWPYRPWLPAGLPLDVPVPRTFLMNIGAFLAFPRITWLFRSERFP